MRGTRSISSRARQQAHARGARTRGVRLSLVSLFLLAVFVVLLGRLFQLQVVEAAAWRAEARRHQLSVWKFRPWRGRILDRHGHVLAESRPALRVDLDPSVIDGPRRFAVLLSDLLGGDPRAEQIAGALLQERRRAQTTGRPISQWIPLVAGIEDPLRMDRLIDFASLSAGQKMRLGLWGAIVSMEEARHYPNGSLGAHVLGRVPRGESLPVGIEGALDGRLRGREMRARLVRDGRQRVLVMPEPSAGEDRGGGDVTLTLDVSVQFQLESALRRMIARHDSLEACGIVLDPKSGEVLALASYPTFDPNSMGASLNLAVQGLYEPGSLFKPFTVAFALEDGRVGANEVLSMPALLALPGDPHPVRDSHEIGDGPIAHLLAQSSNTGAALLAERLGAERFLARLAWIFPYEWESGRSRPRTGTGLGLPWEKGYVRPRRDRGLTPTDLHRFGFGQGFALTPLQLACAYAALARNDGRWVRPRIVRSPDAPAPQTRPLFSRPTVAAVREGLTEAVRSGTARKAFAGCAIQVAGKTATAQQRCRAGRREVVLRGMAEGSLYVANTCGFCGYAPVADPEVVVLVLARQCQEDGVGGGTVAAPAARAVLEDLFAYWGLLPAEAPVQAVAGASAFPGTMGP